MKDFHKKESPLLGLTGTGGGLGYLAGGGVVESLYVDDVFSTYVYTGNSTAGNAINNGIDLASEGGAVWVKNRGATDQHLITDTPGKILTPSDTDSEYTGNTGYIQSFDSNGFTLGAGVRGSNNSDGQVSWTFRKAPGFFDVVRYNGTGSAQNISHNLGSVPGMILIKCTSHTSDWSVYHRSLGATKNMHLNDTSVADTQTGVFNNTEPTSTQFTVNYDGDVNGNGKTYCAFLFAHDEQTFGDDNDESIIKCGSYTGNGTSGNPNGNLQNLGFEPQWIMIKNTSRDSDPYTGWLMFDNMRGTSFGKGTSDPTGDDEYIYANKPNAKAEDSIVNFTPVGFSLTNSGYNLNTNGDVYIYCAIRRPHKPPTAGTDVFNAVTRSGVNATVTASSGNSRVTDMIWTKNRSSGNSPMISARLQGRKALDTSGSSDDSGTFWNSRIFWDVQHGVKYAQYDQVNQSGSNYIDYFFTRAPGVFDVVSYRANNNTAFNVNHNLGVAPELVMIKRRDGNNDWLVGADALTGWGNYGLQLQSTGGENTSSNYFNGAPTSTQIKIGTASDGNYGTGVYIAYLFASKPGISKVGYYTGTGADGIQVDCGFTNGARFVMVKRVDGTGNWNVFDTARGIVDGYDPQLALNSSNSELTNNDFIDTLSSGFIINNTGTAMNANGGKYLFLAIA